MESGVWQVLNRLVFDALLSPQDVILSQFYRNKMSLCGVAVAAGG